jgi:hypothetical protein
MQTAVISFNWRPARADLAHIPGMLADPGGFCYAIHYADGRKRIGGTSRTADTAKAFQLATNAARRAGFTHYTLADSDSAAVPLYPLGVRLYHLVAINERTGAKTYLTGYADTHEACCTMKSRFSYHPARRIQLEEFTPY